MIICIQPLEMWTGNIDPDFATYLEIPDTIDFEAELEKCYYGENDQILVEHFLNLGATKVDNPIRTIYV